MAGVHGDPSDHTTIKASSPRPTTENMHGQDKEQDLEAARLPAADNNKNATLKDPNLVDWDGPSDPANPKNWTVKDKWVLTVLVSTFTFISPVSSSMVAPALTILGKDLGMHKDIEVEMALSIFVLGYSVGPLLFGPLSEIFGRSMVLQCSNLFYLAWNLGCGFAQTRAEMFVFRFLAGIGGSAPLSIGGGTLRYVVLGTS